MSPSSPAADRPALFGGKPVRDRLLPYGRQSVDEADIAAVVAVLRSEWLTTGPKVGEFEGAFAAYVGSAYAVAFSSGTAALHGAVFAAGIGPDDEAVTTPMTFCATANSLLYQGARPQFADVCPDTLNLDPAQVAAKIGPRTRAIIAVDYAGHPADLAALQELRAQHGLVLIEDACHAPGATYHGSKVGSIADLTVFSFHPVKHLATGEGGMVTTNQASYARQLRLFRNHGMESDARQRQSEGGWYYEMVALGYNYRLTDVACALGLSQLRKLDTFLARRRQIAARYQAAFRDLPGLREPSARGDVEPAWHLYPIQVDAKILGAGRADVFRALRAEGLGVNVHFIPVHCHPYYRQRFPEFLGTCPVAESAYERLISLPIFPAMTDGDVDDVIRAVGKVLDYFRLNARPAGVSGA